MNERLNKMKERVRSREHAALRQKPVLQLWQECESEGLTWMQRSARLTRRMCETEQPVILPGERILFTRTNPEVPPVYSQDQFTELTKDVTLHELGPISNICANWGKVLADGLAVRKEKAIKGVQRFSSDAEKVEFLESAVETIDAVLDLAERYATAADELGKTELAQILRNVPRHAPSTFHEALQSLRLLHAVVWMSGHYHVGLGRFDQYMYPYLKVDLENGCLTQVQAQELLAEFFISLNKDSDLYPGVQQGDNGQTLTLGGMMPEGQDGVNELTWMCLRAARDVSMIDPKINFRVSSQTSLELLTLASELTRKGLGFPQYSNDDVVIPALNSHGYALADARDYTVAACWEFIIPGRGMEVVNIGAVSFPHAVDKAIRESLASRETFLRLQQNIKRNILEQVRGLAASYEKLWLPPAPYYSTLMEGCLERGRDLSVGLKYNNFGIHGAASANAADALAAVSQFVYHDKAISAGEMLEALRTDYQNAEDLRRQLREEGPKTANRDELADEMLAFLFESLAEACHQVQEELPGRKLRPGSGSAMYYVWLAKGQSGMREPLVGATADGRKAGEHFSANLAPSPGLQNDSPLAAFESFCKINYQEIYNGGPVTIELSDTVFRNQESLEKVALLVQTFIRLGGQQLQINSLNAEILLDARENPQKYPNLIVRVWGWSGYFCELAPVYQDHIIQRCLYKSA